MVFKIKLYFFFTFLSVAVLGQDIDTLMVKLASLPPGIERVDILNRIVTQMRERNIFEAVKYGIEARTLAETLEYSAGLELALENLGWIYYRRGIYSDAFEISHRALRIGYETGDSAAIARCLNNVAAINYERAEYKDAIKRFSNAYLISSKLGDIHTAVRSLNNIALSHFSLQNPDTASYYAYQALDKSQEIVNESYMPAFSYRILGDIAYGYANMELALQQYSESMRISETSGNYFIQTSTLHRIGRVYAKQKRYDRALEVLHRNVTLSQNNGYANELERTYKLISDINYEKNDIATAFKYLSLHLALHDSLINQRSSERMSLLAAKFESELKQSQIEVLTKNAKLKEEEINNQRAWSYFYVGCFVLGLIIAGILYYSNRKIKKINLELKDRKTQVEIQATQLANINKTKDKLLSIISHDVRGPLSSLKGMLSITQSGDINSEEFSHLTSQISNQLNAVYDDLGTLLHWTQSQLQGLTVNEETFSMKDVADEVVSLFAATAQSKNILLVNNIDSGTKVKADINHARLILRNLLSNAIKFTNEGGQVIIENSADENFVKVSVCDSGMGIDHHQIPKLFNASAHFTKVGTANEKGMGVGLLLTKEFVDKNGGSLSVESVPGSGATFTFTLKKAV